MVSSTIRALLPLIILLLLASSAAWLLYQIYLSFTSIRRSASERMTRHNVVFTRDGVRIGVKETSNEKYVDATQSYIVKAWNLAASREDDELKKARKRKN